jgi:hypothetical protein
MIHTNTIDVTPSESIVCPDGEVLPTPTAVLTAIARDTQIPLAIIQSNRKLQQAAQQVFRMQNQEALDKLQQVVDSLGNLAAADRRDARAIDRAIAPITKSITMIAQRVAENSQGIKQLGDRVTALESSLPTAREAYLMGKVNGMEAALQLQGQPSVTINNTNATNTSQQSGSTYNPRLRLEGYDAELPIAYYVRPNPVTGREEECAMLRPIPAGDEKLYTDLYGSIDRMLQTRMNERRGVEKMSITGGHVLIAIFLALFLSVLGTVLSD